MCPRNSRNSQTTQYAAISGNLPASPEVTNYWHDGDGHRGQTGIYHFQKW